MQLARSAPPIEIDIKCVREKRTLAAPTLRRVLCVFTSPAVWFGIFFIILLIVELTSAWHMYTAASCRRPPTSL